MLLLLLFSFVIERIQLIFVCQWWFLVAKLYSECMRFPLNLSLSRFWQFIEKESFMILNLISILYKYIYRNSSFKEDDVTWKGNEDGKIINNQPTRVMDDRNGVAQLQAGYIVR